MNATQFRLWKHSSRIAIVVATLAAVVAGGWFGRSYFTSLSAPQQSYVCYTVSRADLPIVITERGNLESQVRTEIRCEVENISVDRSGNYGTQIIYIVPNGSAVKEGDLLVELDSAAIRDRLDLQTLGVQKATSARIQAQARYENQKTQNETLEAEAKLKLELAKLQLLMYMDKESGEYRLALDEIDRTIDESKNAILEAQAALELQKTEKHGIQTLFEMGYRGKSDLDQTRFKFLQAEDKLASAVNRLTTGQASRLQMEKYVHEMRRKTLEGDVETAERNVQQVLTDNESKLQQALAAKDEAESTETKEKERLAKLKLQLSKCKIIAPHDGMVVYAREDRYGDTEIAEGVTVRERQQILSLPDLSRMQVKCQIHEAVLDQVQAGLPVTIKVDAFPNRQYVGLVDDVAVVPTSGGWSSSSSAKTYTCNIKIPDRVENLKPGMTAVADIHVDRIRNVTAVPVQAIFQIDKDHWCYVDGEGGPQKRKVELGLSNDKFVHIASGLELDERVVLNPMSLWETHEAEEREIAPDSGAPDVPVLTPEQIAATQPEPKKEVTKAPPKGKRRNPFEGKSKAVEQAPAGGAG